MIHKRFEVRRADDGDSWELLEVAPDGTVLRFVGADDGEPEDQLLVRNWAWVPKEMNALADEIERLRADRAQLLEASSAAAKAIVHVDRALDEFSSHHLRPDGRPLTVLECVEEAMLTLRTQLAELGAERMKLREALEPFARVAKEPVEGARFLGVLTTMGVTQADCRRAAEVLGADVTARGQREGAGASQTWWGRDERP